MPRFTGLRNIFDGRIRLRCVVVRNENKSQRDCQPHQCRQVITDTADTSHTLHDLRRDREKCDRGNASGDKQALIERRHDFATGTDFDKENADDRGKDGHTTQSEWIQNRRIDTFEHRKRQHHRCHGRDCVGFKQVGRHTRAITDIVAYVVGNDRRVTWVVLRNPCLDFADEIRAHIRRLRVDSAADPGKHGDQTAAEAQTEQRMNGFLLTCQLRGESVEAGDSQQPQPDQQ